jgi:peptide/nickel transport system permease protein
MNRLAVVAVRAIPTVFMVTVLVFLVARLLPGDVVELRLQDANLSQSELQQQRAALGLNEPLTGQYVLWLQHAVHGDLGRSLWTGAPVSRDIQHRLPVTLELAVLAAAWALVMGTTVGILSAVRMGRFSDYAGRTLAILGLSMPEFVVGTVILLVFSRYLGWIPPRQYRPFLSDPSGNLLQFIIPALILGSTSGALVMRMTRTAVLEVLNQDYVRTARAKGLGGRLVLRRHVLLNATPPILALFGLVFAQLLSGTVILESIFGLPGLGQYMLDSVLRRDYISIQGVALVVAIGVLAVNAVIDCALDAASPTGVRSQTA